MKRIRKIVALVLASGFLINSVVSFSEAAFKNGTNTVNFDYASSSGYVNILSSSASANGQMGYWYQGTIGISQAKKISVRTEGYYYNSRGILSYGANEESGTSKNITAQFTVPGGCAGCCDSSHKAKAIGRVNGTIVAQPKYPA